MPLNVEHHYHPGNPDMVTLTLKSRNRNKHFILEVFVSNPRFGVSYTVCEDIEGEHGYVYIFPKDMNMKNIFY